MKLFAVSFWIHSTSPGHPDGGTHDLSLQYVSELIASIHQNKVVSNQQTLIILNINCDTSFACHSLLKAVIIGNYEDEVP